MEWPNNEADNQVLVEMRGPREFAIGFTWDVVSLTNSAPLNSTRSHSTGNYRYGPIHYILDHFLPFFIICRVTRNYGLVVDIFY